MANPTVLTEESLTALAAALRGGSSISAAARAAGISTSSAYRAVHEHDLPLPGDRRARRPKPKPRRGTAGDPNREAILAHVRQHVAAHGQPPTQRETAAALGLAPATVSYHVRLLTERGLLSGGKNQTRGAALRGAQFWEAMSAIRQVANRLGPYDQRARVLYALCVPFYRPRRDTWTMPADGIKVTVEHLVLKHGRPVTEEEVAQATGLSAAVVGSTVDRLVEWGEIVRCSPGMRRPGPSPVVKVLSVLRRPGALVAMPKDAQEPLRLVLGVLSPGGL